jgi:uncharacterized membrane protein
MISPTPSYRVASIDILRGLIMIIMALDHTREFFHITAMTADPLNGSTTTIPLFFTRWITHFCAPGFVFLSGLSAWLSSGKKSKSAASLFLLKRGSWLILVEVTLVTFGITFNPFFNLVVWQVIWAIGWSMIVLGLLMRISNHLVLIAGIILVFGHNILDYFELPGGNGAGYAWTVLFTARGTSIPLDSTHAIGVFYAIMPWTGLMLLGYSIGSWYQKDFPAPKRKKFLITAGVVTTILFIGLRYIRGYGDPGAWDGKSFFSFLNTSKYPPSLQFSSMTLGSLLILLSLLENVRAGWSKVLAVYGRVPFFYYILHFYLLHILLVIAFFASGHTVAQISDPRSPFMFRPLLFGYNLGIVYLVWFAVVAALYYPCRWFNKIKIGRTEWWLKYL